jgi:hypothetical protein
MLSASVVSTCKAFAQENKDTKQKPTKQTKAQRIPDPAPLHLTCHLFQDFQRLESAGDWVLLEVS